MADKHPNPVLHYFSWVRPSLWEAPEWEKVALILHHAMVHTPTPEWNHVTDALAELIPEKREFWLRVQATWNHNVEKWLVHSGILTTKRSKEPERDS